MGVKKDYKNHLTVCFLCLITEHTHTHHNHITHITQTWTNFDFMKGELNEDFGISHKADSVS